MRKVKYIKLFSAAEGKQTTCLPSICEYLYVMHQSIPAAPSPQGPISPDISNFLPWIYGNFPWAGTLELPNPPGVETNKESKCPVLHQHCNIFIDHTVESWHILSILICDFLFQLTSAFVIELTILIKTSRDDDTSLVSLW